MHEIRHALSEISHHMSLVTTQPCSVLRIGALHEYIELHKASWWTRRMRQEDTPFDRNATSSCVHLSEGKRQGVHK